MHRHNFSTVQRRRSGPRSRKFYPQGAGQPEQMQDILFWISTANRNRGAEGDRHANKRKQEYLSADAVATNLCLSAQALGIKYI